MKKLKIVFLLFCLFLPLSFFGCENFNKNTLSTPSNLSAENGVIVFDIVKDAEYYIVNINDNEFTLDARYSNNVQLIDQQVNYNANKVLTVGESYAIKVKAIASEMNDSAYSETISYKHTSSISKPENIKINGTTLTWDVVKNASFYLVKIVTPYNTKIYDHNGNELSGDDSETIAKAELTAYSFSSNTFNFSSLLTEAGNYNFYINAVSADGNKYSDSGYTNKTTYKHVVDLETPVVGSVALQENGDLILSAVIDSNTNYITVSCNEYKKSVELTDMSLLNNIVGKSNNVLTINLTNYFNELDFSLVKPYEFKIQAKHITNAENAFYKESKFSQASVFESSSILTTPTLSINYNEKNSCYEALWTYDDISNVSKFNVYVLSTSLGLKTYELENTANSLMLPEDYYAVGIQAVGGGNYLSSNLSNFITSSTSSSLSNIKISKSGNNRLTWNNTANAYYFIEHNNQLSITTENSFNIDLQQIKHNSTPLKLTVIKEGFLPYVVNYSFEYNPQLSTPTIYGFVSSNPYLLTFEKIENAICYQVRIKSSEQQEFNTIHHMYTTNAIDLSQYVISEDDTVSYFVQVQAVADSLGIYADSDYSSSVSVTHQRILSKPTFIGEGISKKIEGNQTLYTLNFTGVEKAESYEILINYNKLTVQDTNKSSYSVDVSRYLTSANNYEIKIRAIPSVYASNLYPSEYAKTNYILTKQLSQVEEINISNNNGIYTLSFTPVNNAVAYSVRIVKVGDAGYADYLNALDTPLSPIFTVHKAEDISKYVQQKGEYHIYMTALASEGGYYGSSDESSTYGIVTKLNSLQTPTNFNFNKEQDDSTYNLDENTYILSWVGDEHADYYLVKIVDPNGFKYELNVYGSTNTNISKYLTIQGYYSFSVCSMVTPNSENSINYTSSSYGEVGKTYVYQRAHDFKRYSISMYGEKYDYEINTVQDLKNILWYHIIYGVNKDYKLPIYIATSIGELVRDKLVDIADASTSADLYNFDADSEWTTNKLPANKLTTNVDLLQYISKSLISVYPQMHIIGNVVCEATENPNVFILNFANSLTPSLNNTLISETPDHNSFFKYLDSRRGESVKFAIDNSTGVAVTTSEQLLHAVENGNKPLFCGESQNAETIYNNAKAVLRAIISSNMSELEKTTRIFDWLSYAYNINFYADKKISTDAADNTIYIDEELSNYGKRLEFYLEGMFMNIPINSKGEFDETNYTTQIATSTSLSKAFSLMCAIEGIKATTIYGYCTSNETDYNHTWNKVYISTTSNINDKAWYVVDIAKSETLENKTSRTYTYFLVTDELHTTLLNTKENTKDFMVSAATKYNHYSNATFGLTINEIYKYLTKNIYQYSYKNNFNYSKSFSSSNTYYTFALRDLNTVQSYLFNIIFYTKYMLTVSGSNTVSFDFSFDWSNYSGSDNFYTSFNSIKTEVDNILSQISSYYTNFNMELNFAEQIKDTVNERTIVILTFKNK